MFDEDTGAIAGVILDDALLPISGVDVALSQIGSLTQTDENGRFNFSFVEPGEVVLSGSKSGYEGATAKITVAAGQTTNAQLILKPIATDVPFHQFQHWGLFTYCWISNYQFASIPCTKLVDYVTGLNVSGEEQFAFSFEIEFEGLADILSEIDWAGQALGKENLFYVQTPAGQPVTAATERYFLMKGDPPLRGWIAANVANGDNWEVFDAEPGKIRYEAVVAGSDGNSTIPGVGIFINHRVDAWLTFFYNRPGPKDFTALPDE